MWVVIIYFIIFVLYDINLWRSYKINYDLYCEFIFIFVVKFLSRLRRIFNFVNLFCCKLVFWIFLCCLVKFFSVWFWNLVVIISLFFVNCYNISYCEKKNGKYYLFGFFKIRIMSISRWFFKENLFGCKIIYFIYSKKIFNLGFNNEEEFL